MSSICNYTCIELGREVCGNTTKNSLISNFTRISGLSTGILTLLLFLTFSVSTSQAQTDFYNQNFVKLTDLHDIKAFVADMKENCVADRYRLNKTAVVEYYDKKDKTFKGMCVDSKLATFDKINVIKADKGLKKFIKIHGLALGSALYFKRPFEGMNQGQLKLIAGEPDRIKYSIDGESQVIHFKYNDGRIYTFKDGSLMKPINDTSKSPIALKQP